MRLRANFFLRAWAISDAGSSDLGFSRIGVPPGDLKHGMSKIFVHAQ